MATPLFLITNPGLAVASAAGPHGPYINIVGFKIGSAYGYTPTNTQTDIEGTLLYEAAPTTYQFIGNNTINIICEIPPQAGPFQFGEVALYLADSSGGFSSSSVMFAIAVFDTPQQKFSSLGSNVVSSYQFNCLLKLQQSTAVFQISTAVVPPTVLDIYQWSDVIPPGLAANPSVPIYNVHEANEFGDGSILSNENTNYWTIGSTSYNKYFGVASHASPFFTVAASSTSWVEFPASMFHTQDLTTVNRRFLIKTPSPDTYIRSVSSVVTSGSNYRFNLNVTNDGTYNNYPLPSAPTVGQACEIYRDDQAGGFIYYDQIINPPSIPLGTPGTPGLVYGGNGTYMPSAGIIEAHGLLQSPSTNTGRVLTSADNLNNIGLTSGLYIANGGSGYPANVPFTIAANIYNHNIGNGTTSANGSDVTQIWYPWNSAGGSSAGVGGLPPYWRQGYNTGANWTNWMPLIVAGRTSSLASQFAPSESFVSFTLTTPNTLNLSGTTPTAGVLYAYQVMNNSGGNNGARITSNISLTTPSGTSTNNDTITGNSTYNSTVQPISANQAFSVAGTTTLVSGGAVAISQATGFFFIPTW